MRGMNGMFKILIFFLITQLIGIYAGYVIFIDITNNPYVSALVVSTDSNSLFNVFWLGIYVITGAILMLFLIKFFSYDFFFAALEFFLISIASSITFYSFLRLIFNYEISMIFGILLALILAGTKILFPQLKNLAVIFATVGVSVTFGISFAPQVIILFLVVVSIYDYLAVFVTKHMVELANFVIKKNLAFTITVKEMMEGKEKRVDLGSGDFIMPLMFEVSLIPFSFNAVLVVFLGAMITCAIFMYMVWHKRFILPAIPPLVLGMISAFLVGLVIGIY